MNILVTGAAGFIGMHTSERLLQQGHHVLGLDSFSPYYDVGLKRDRASVLLQHPNFQLLEADINRADVLIDIEKIMKPQRVVHLAAQVGVRHSILQPMDYASANLTGFLQVLEWSRRWKAEHFVYASSSSVYGGNRTYPFAELPVTGSSFTTTTVPVVPRASDAPVKNAALPGVHVPVNPEITCPLSGKAISNVTLPGTANPPEPVILGAIAEITDPAFTEAEVTVSTPAPPQPPSAQAPLPQPVSPEIVPV